MDENRDQRGVERRPGEPMLDDSDLADLVEGIRLFNDGKFWHAHEAWEEVWRRKAGEWDAFFKGIIQAAAAFHKMGEGSLKGTRIHLDRSITKLRPCAPEFLGIKIAALLRDLERCRDEIERGRFPVRAVPVLRRVH